MLVGNYTYGRWFGARQTRWELRGLDYQVKPSEFDLGIVGSLYLEKGGFAAPRLKGQMKLSVDLAIPPSLALMPAPVIESFGRAVSELDLICVHFLPLPRLSRK